MIQNKTLGDRLFNSVVAVLLLLLGLCCLLPLMHIVALSFSSKAAALSGHVGFFPVEFTLTPYKYLVNDVRYIASFWVSVRRVILGGTINLIFTILTAYPLSMEREEFPARDIYMWVVIFTMLFGGSIVPWYFVIRSTGLMDTIWALVLPGAVPVYNTILLMNFFRNQPKAIKESALIDGVSPLQMMARICVPLALPAIATVTLFSLVNHWNTFFDGMLLINSPLRMPLQTYIQALSGANASVSSAGSLTPEELEALTSLRTFNAAKVVVASIPILLIYPFMQRYFVAGITLGSVKE